MLFSKKSDQGLYFIYHVGGPQFEVCPGLLCQDNFEHYRSLKALNIMLADNRKNLALDTHISIEIYNTTGSM